MHAVAHGNDGTNGLKGFARGRRRSPRAAFALCILLLGVPAFPISLAPGSSDEAGKGAGRCSPKVARPVRSETVAPKIAQPRSTRAFSCEPLVRTAEVAPARVPAPLKTSVVGARTMSERGLEHLVECEGFAARPYDDAGRCSVGYGHRAHDGPCSRAAHRRIGEGEARALLLADVARCERTVNELVHVPLDQGQFDALVSFVFNVGRRGFRDSRLLQSVNAGEFWRVPGELRRWVYQGEKRVQGLVNRREKEILLFTSESS